MPYKDATKRKAYHKEYGKQHYEDNKELYKSRAKINTARYIEENREKLWAYLEEHPCVDCGEADIVVLSFDHLRDKKKTISRLVSDGASWDTILKEIVKCQVRCCSCHIKKTAKQLGWKKAKFLGDMAKLVDA